MKIYGMETLQLRKGQTNPIQTLSNCEKVITVGTAASYSADVQQQELKGIICCRVVKMAFMIFSHILVETLRKGEKINYG
jgi:hypothetical protein